MAEEPIVVAPDLEIRVVAPADLTEQAVNAQVMTPGAFDRLVENIRRRGSLESLPYCSQPLSQGPIEIVSGHHRVRAARVAGLSSFPVLVDTAPMTRSEIAAKQIAHNTLVGTQDEKVLAQLVANVVDVDDLLATGLDPSQLPNPASDPAPALITPTAAMEWHVASLTFLPAAFDDFRALGDALAGRQDLVGACPVETYKPFAQALASYSRIRDVRNLGTAVGLLTRIALEEVARLETLDPPSDT